MTNEKCVGMSLVAYSRKKYDLELELINERNLYVHDIYDIYIYIRIQMYVWYCLRKFKKFIMFVAPVVSANGLQAIGERPPGGANQKQF